MNPEFEKLKKTILEDTVTLQQINDDLEDLNIINILNLLDNSWYLPILNLAIENNNTEIIQYIITRNPTIIDQEVISKRDFNRKKLIKVFFKKILF
jgi:hypothetical protein